LANKSEGEQKMRKLYTLTLIVIICLIIGLAYADQLTFSTYYPAPFGVYREMRAMRMAIGDTYHKTGDHPWDEDGSGDPGEIHQDADLVVEGNVGIGTATPTTDPNPNGDTAGNLDVADVWLRGANDGTGGWASEGGGVTTWDSGWFAISNNRTQNKTHDLGAKPDIMTVWAATNSTGANMRYVGSINAGSGNYGCSIYNITAIGYSIKTYNDSVGAVGESNPWRYARLVMMKVQ